METKTKYLAEAPASESGVETFYTIPQACRALGIRKHALRRAISRGLIPCYMPFGSRRLVKLSEITAMIEQRRVGGLSDD